MSAYMKQGMYTQVNTWLCYHVHIGYMHSQYGDCSQETSMLAGVLLFQLLKAFKAESSVTAIVPQRCAVFADQESCLQIAKTMCTHTCLLLYVSRHLVRNNAAVQVQQVFDDMYTAGLQPNIMTYITSMSAYAKLGDWQRAVQLIDHMCQPQVKQETLLPKLVTYKVGP